MVGRIFLLFVASFVVAFAFIHLPGAELRPRWRLVWSDEFDGPDGSAPDPAKWRHDVGGHGWGNRELQYYTDRLANASIQNGRLVITARRERFTGPDLLTRAYTSARVHTRGRFASRYGRFEARIKMPSGKGLWPAFWMLGTNLGDAGWPACGEIDIVENIGSEPSTIHGTLHGPGYSHASGITASYTLPNAQRFADDFHVFAVEWEQNAIRFYADDSLYRTATPADLPHGKRWIFDHAFFLILNVAVGGNWPGHPAPPTMFPQTMEVDYVRVFERQP